MKLSPLSLALLVLFDGATAPPCLIDSAAGRVSVLRSPSTFYGGDGRFYAFEGCSSDTGCCPLNCTHVDGHPFFPRLSFFSGILAIAANR